MFDRFYDGIVEDLGPDGKRGQFVGGGVWESRREVLGEGGGRTRKPRRITECSVTTTTVYYPIVKQSVLAVGQENTLSFGVVLVHSTVRRV